MTQIVKADAPSATTTERTRIWAQLLPEVEDRIIFFAEPNEIACTIRLLCKAAAFRFRGPHHTTTRLSQPVPPHAFARRCAGPGATRGLTLRARQDLLALTARSGSLINLQMLLPAVGCPPTARVLAAAASGGHLAACQWLRTQSCPWNEEALTAAGRSGCLPLCRWLMAAGSPGEPLDALLGAARAGQVGLVEQLLAAHGPPEDRGGALAAVAEGCDLATLQRLHAAWLGGGGGEAGGGGGGGGRLPVWQQWEVLGGAARSPTLDWAAKLAWLRGGGYPAHTVACAAAAACPEGALERLTWLAARGWPVAWQGAAPGAARRGDVPALEFLLPPPEGEGAAAADGDGFGNGLVKNELLREAAEAGQVAVLRLLHERRWRVQLSAVAAAARRGHAHVVAWAAEALGAVAVLQRDVFAAAARSGSVELMAWLRERGCPWDAGAWGEAAEAGCGEALEWLAAGGCPLPDPAGQHADRPYLAAAAAGDTHTLTCLARLGLPYSASTFLEAVRRRAAPLPALRWLAAHAPCRVDWHAALAAAWSPCGGTARSEAEVVEWLSREEAAAAEAQLGGGALPAREGSVQVVAPATPPLT